MNDDPTTREQRLLDALQTIAPLVERLHVTARQHQFDAEAVLEATRRAVALVKQQREGSAR